MSPRITLLFGFTLFMSLILIQTASASQLKLLCLDEGDVLKFSRCNPSIDDRECDASTGCNYCVNEIRNGVYCPTSINFCNAASLSCSAMQEPISNDDTQDDDNNDDNNDNSQDDNDDQNNDNNDNSNNNNDNNINNDNNNDDNQNDNTQGDDTNDDNDDSNDNRNTNLTNSTDDDVNFGFKVGTNVVKPSAKNETSQDQKSTSPSPISGLTFGSSSKQKNFMYILFGMTLIEIIIILGLVNFQKNKQIKKMNGDTLPNIEPTEDKTKSVKKK